MCSPPHTTSDATMSAVDSTASATSAYVCPKIPAASFTAASRALTTSPVWAARIAARCAGLTDDMAPNLAASDPGEPPRITRR